MSRVTYFLFRRPIMLAGLNSLFNPEAGIGLRLGRLALRHYNRDVELCNINLVSSTSLTLEEDLFQQLSEGKDVLPLSRITTRLKQSGLLLGDQRLCTILQKLNDLKRVDEAITDEIVLNLEQFRDLVKCHDPLMYKTFTNNLVIPQFAELVTLINDLYWKCLKNITGTVTSYSKVLSSETLDKWSVSVCTVDGQRHSIGYSNVPVVLHSCSNPISFALAVEEHGGEIIKQYVANEPLSQGAERFKSLNLCQMGTPHNPLSDAGTLVTTSLLYTRLNYQDKLAKIMERYRSLSGGGKVDLSQMFYKHQKGACDHIWANAYFLSNSLCFPAGTDLDQMVDLHLKLQSLQLTSEDLSVLASTLANGGICPTTGEVVLSLESTNAAVSIMFTCGISEKFTLEVGIPGVTGISGGLMVVIPGLMGMFLWSPLLNSEGTSVRALQFCEKFSKSLDLHYFSDKISGHSNEKVLEISTSHSKHLRHGEAKISTRIRSPHTDRYLRTIQAMFAAKYNDLTALRTLYLANHDMNDADYDGRTPLHVASSEGRLEAVKFLVEKCGVDINVKDKRGSTPFDNSRKFKRIIVEEYLKASAK